MILPTVEEVDRAIAQKLKATLKLSAFLHLQPEAKRLVLEECRRFDDEEVRIRLARLLESDAIEQGVKTLIVEILGARS